ncbi:MAG: methyltransferase domain-containing protein, partial [Elusimicrobiota bacterium]|nr:methyltransferase domain-containing protein [Elusimicrobiota bacterium]
MNIIKNSFSKASTKYENYAHIQNEIAKILLKKIKNHFITNDPKKILDIGSGTGIFTRILKQNFFNSKIFAFDISPNMIKLAEQKNNYKKGSKVSFFCADAEDFKNLKKIKDANQNLIFSKNENNKFDLISANSSIQWLKNFENILKFYSKFLIKNGFFIFSVFGNKKFCELNSALKKFYQNSNFNPDNTEIISTKFLTKKDYIKILEKFDFLENLKIEEIFLKKNYSNIFELLQNIKGTGTNIKKNTNIRQIFWTPKMLKDLEGIYRAEKSNIYKD